MSDRLFDAGPTVQPVTLSADARRTARRNEALANGRHPLRMDPLREPEGETCGSCRYSEAHGHNLRTYWKCGLRPHEITSGAATDIRVSWPACIRWEAVAYCAGRVAVAHEREPMDRVGNEYKCPVCGEIA